MPATIQDVVSAFTRIPEATSGLAMGSPGQVTKAQDTYHLVQGDYFRGLQAAEEQKQRQNQVFGALFPRLTGLLDQFGPGMQSAFAALKGGGGAAPGIDINAILAPIQRQFAERRQQATNAFTGAGRDITSTALQGQILPQLASREAEALGAEGAKAQLQGADVASRNFANQLQFIATLQPQMLNLIQSLMGLFGGR